MSNIISVDIDETFPVAGTDNDSQGFRDNFNIIENSLATAKSEITTLENNTAKLNEDNNFAGSEIQQAKLINTTEKFISQSVASSESIRWTFAQYQDVIIGADVQLTLTDWPTSGEYGKIKIGVYGNGEGSHTVTWAATGGNNIKAPTGFPSSFTITSDDNPKIFEFWTVDGGTTVFGNYLGEFIS